MLLKSQLVSPELEAFILPHERIGLFRKATPDSTANPNGRDFIGAIAVFLAAAGQPGHEQSQTTWAVKPSFQDSSPQDASTLLAEHEHILDKRRLEYPDDHPDHNARSLFKKSVLQATSRHKSLHGSHHLLGLMTVYKATKDTSVTELWVPRTFQLEVSATAHRLEAEAKEKWLQQLTPDERAVRDYIHPHACAQDMEPLVDTTVRDILLGGLPSRTDLRQAIPWHSAQAPILVPPEWTEEAVVHA